METAPASLRRLAPPLRDAGERFGRTVLGPMPTRQDPIAQHNARLISGLGLALSVHALSMIFVEGAVASDEPHAVLTRALCVIAMSYAVVYILARGGAARVATYLAIGVQLAAPLAIAHAIPAHAAPMSTAAWMLLAILTAGALLRPNATLIAGAGATAALLGGLLMGDAPRAELSQALALVLGVTVLMYVYTRHRDHVEEVRQANLRDKNAALEELRATLEQRVRERTEELERSHTDLEHAFSALEQNQEALLQTEKMAAIGRLTAGIAHELSSPLGAVIASSTELVELCDEMRRSATDADVTKSDFVEIAEDMKEAIALVELGATRAANFVRGIRSHTRDTGPMDRTQFDATPVVRDALQLVAHAARAARATVSFDAPKIPVELFGTPSRLSQAVVNVVGNAIDAVGEKGGGKVAVRLTSQDGHVVLEVEDNGPGIRPSVRPRIFEPLFTTKPHGKGTGLGLAIVNEIVTREFHGHVGVEGGAMSGARFMLEIPKAEEASHGA